MCFFHRTHICVSKEREKGRPLVLKTPKFAFFDGISLNTIDRVITLHCKNVFRSILHKTGLLCFFRQGHRWPKRDVFVTYAKAVCLHLRVNSKIEIVRFQDNDLYDGVSSFYCEIYNFFADSIEKSFYLRWKNEPGRYAAKKRTDY